MGRQLPISGGEFHTKWSLAMVHVHKAGPPWLYLRSKGGPQASWYTPTLAISKGRAACSQDPPLLETGAHEQSIQLMPYVSVCVCASVLVCLLRCAGERVDFSTEIIFWVRLLFPIPDHDSLFSLPGRKEGRNRWYGESITGNFRPNITSSVEMEQN